MPDPRVQAMEALQLHSEGRHAEALTRAMKLARANPDSAPALNLAGALHVHASGAGRKERAPRDDDDNDDDEAASALVSHHRRAAVDAFSAAARIAPSCVMTAVLHAEALVADHRSADALLELARVLWTTAKADHDDPAVHHVAYEYDLVGGSTAEVRKSDAVYKASVVMEDLAAMINKARIVPRDAAVDQVRQGAQVLSRTYPYSVRALFTAAAASSEVKPTAEAVKAGPALEFKEQVIFTLPIMTGDSYWDDCNCHMVKIFRDAAEVRKKIHDLERGKSDNSDATLVLWGYLDELLSAAKAIAKTLEKMNLVPYPEPHWFRNRDTGMAVSMDLTDWESQVALFLSPEGSAPREEGLAEKSESPAVIEVGPVERNLSEEVLGEQCALTLPSHEKIAGISFWDGWQRLDSLPDSLEEEEGRDEVALTPGVAFWEIYQDRSNVTAFTAMLDDDMYMADKKAEWCCGA